MVDVNIVNFITIGLMGVAFIAVLKWLSSFVGFNLDAWI